MTATSQLRDDPRARNRIPAPAERRGPATAWDTIEELDTEVIFELALLRAWGVLSDLETLGGSPEVELRGNSDEISKFRESMGIVTLAEAGRSAHHAVA